MKTTIKVNNNEATIEGTPQEIINTLTLLMNKKTVERPPKYSLITAKKRVNRWQRYTAEEIAYIKNNPHLNASTIAKKLGRTSQAISTQRWCMKRGEHNGQL